jgi:hypothetical protein
MRIFEVIYDGFVLYRMSSQLKYWVHDKNRIWNSNNTNKYVEL